MSRLSLDRLLELEHAGWRSLCAGRGADFYGDLMTPDGLMVLVNGMVLDREQVIEALAASPAWQRYDLADPRVVVLGADAAALVYRATATREGSEPFTALMSSVYRWRDGRPRLALYQQTTTTH